jgi:hypothetical protein
MAGAVLLFPQWLCCGGGSGEARDTSWEFEVLKHVRLRSEAINARLTAFGMDGDFVFLISYTDHNEKLIRFYIDNHSDPGLCQKSCSRPQVANIIFGLSQDRFLISGSKFSALSYRRKSPKSREAYRPYPSNLGSITRENFVTNMHKLMQGEKWLSSSTSCRPPYSHQHGRLEESKYRLATGHTPVIPQCRIYLYCSPIVSRRSSPQALMHVLSGSLITSSNVYPCVPKKPVCRKKC